MVVVDHSSATTMNTASPTSVSRDTDPHGPVATAAECSDRVGEQGGTEDGQHVAARVDDAAEGQRRDRAQHGER